MEKTMMIDNETLDKVFNFVFRRYAKLHLVPDDFNAWRSGSCWPKFTIIGEGKIGCWWKDVHEMWVGPPKLDAEGLLTQLRVNALGEDVTKLPASKLEFVLPYHDQVARELPTTASSADPVALRVKQYIAFGVIMLLEQYGGIAIVEDCDVAHPILNVSSLEELLVKADLA